MSPLWAIETPDLADLAARQRVIGVVPGLGREVEGDREPGLALGEVPAVELVRAPRVGMPGVGAHHPRAVALLEPVVAQAVPILRSGALFGAPGMCYRARRMSDGYAQPLKL